MKKTTRKSRVALPEFVSGQIWRMEDSNLQIGLVGKTLVHYKHYRGENKRSPVSLTGKIALEKFLIERKATLTKATPVKTAPAKK